MKMKTAFAIILCGTVSSFCGAMLARALSPGEDAKDNDEIKTTVTTTVTTTVDVTDQTNQVECESEESTDGDSSAYLPQITPGLEGPSASE